jgi:hypothetical protein
VTHRPKVDLRLTLVEAEALVLGLVALLGRQVSFWLRGTERDALESVLGKLRAGLAGQPPEDEDE